MAQQLQQPGNEAYVSGRVVDSSQEDPERPITHGDVLQAVGELHADKPVTPAERSAIQSAEARATGLSSVPGGVGEAARYAAAHNLTAEQQGSDERITMGEVLKDAKDRLLVDREVTQADANRVTRAENRNQPSDEEQLTGVGAAEQFAAGYNK